ncbi:hypothetical protein Ddc_16460 [Ditylenchus destructor]|nr:hypothetical protein Ddc_16460 [Ditylenchus destructor]
MPCGCFDIMDLQTKTYHKHETTDTNQWHPTGINIFDNVLSRYFRSSRGTIEIFDKVLSSHEYNKLVIRNRYSKQIPLETQIAGMKSTQNKRKVYRLYAYVNYDYKDPKSSHKLMFDASVELNHENWPVFQHFFRLLTDPFIYIRSIGLPRQNDGLNLLAGAINPDCGRIQCQSLRVSLKDNEQNRIIWIKGHVHCYQFNIFNWSGSNYDKQLLDLFMTGANFTSKINLSFYDPCKVIGDFVQKFMDLKGCDGDKVVGFIECHPKANVNIDGFKRDYADFVVEGNINETSDLSHLVFEFVNNDIGKKLRLSIDFRTTKFTMKTSNVREARDQRTCQLRHTTGDRLVFAESAGHFPRDRSQKETPKALLKVQVNFTGLKIFDPESFWIKWREDSRDPTGIQIFDKTLSAEEYNKWVIRNGYSKQIPPETQIAGKQGTGYGRKVYDLSAHVDYDYEDPKSWKLVFDARKELNHENWPVFQHFFRLLTDPLIFIHSLGLPHQNDAINLLAGAINPNYGRLQCCTLDVSHEDNMQNRLSWVKGHVHCYKIYINGWRDYISNNVEEFLDFFMTGANCTSRIEVEYYEPCKLVARFVQKFMDLKSGDEDKVVGFIECHPNRNVNMDAFKRNYADFVVEGNINETSDLSNLVFEFVNNDIGKKLRLSIRIECDPHPRTVVTLKTANL